MDLSISHIEMITGERLRRLPFIEDDEGDDGIYCLKGIEERENDGRIHSSEGGFMRGYLQG